MVRSYVSNAPCSFNHTGWSQSLEVKYCKGVCYEASTRIKQERLRTRPLWWVGNSTDMDATILEMCIFLPVWCKQEIQYLLDEIINNNCV